MEAPRKAYTIRWLQSLFKKFRKSGLDKASIDDVIRFWRHPAIDGVLMANPILHTATNEELLAILQQEFDVRENLVILPFNLKHITRQETTTPSSPFSNRKKLADRINTADELYFFDPFMSGKSISVLSEVVELLEKGRLKKILLLTTDKGIKNPSEKQSFIKLTNYFATEYSIGVEVKLTQNAVHPRFFIANKKIWKIGHSINQLDKFEGIDEQLETKEEWERFWHNEWAAGITLN